MIHDDDAIVSLEAWRLRQRPVPTCEHKRTVIDERAGTVECRDCQATLSAFWVLGQIAREENRCFERIKRLRTEAAELETWVPHLRKVRELHRNWSGKKALPICPHCHHGLWPDDFVGFISVELEAARRRKDGRPLPPSAGA
jgi:hypothetical protein